MPLERDGHGMGAHTVACGAACGVRGVAEGGGGTIREALLSLGVALVAITAAQSAPISVGELLSDPDRFRGQPVTVGGTRAIFANTSRARGLATTRSISVTALRPSTWSRMRSRRVRLGPRWLTAPSSR